MTLVQENMASEDRKSKNLTSEIYHTSTEVVFSGFLWRRLLLNLTCTVCIPLHHMGILFIGIKR